MTCYNSGIHRFLSAISFDSCGWTCRLREPNPARSNQRQRMKKGTLVALARSPSDESGALVGSKWKPGKSALRTVITALSTSLVVACIGSSGALACPIAAQMYTILFTEEDLTSGIDAPAVVEVTITSFTKTAVVARVEKVFKGQIDSAEINIVASFSACLLGVAMGVRGIVVGTLQRDPQGLVELRAVDETFVDRERRRTSKANR